MEKLMGKKGLLYAKILSAVLYNAGIKNGDAQIMPIGVGARHLTIGVKLANSAHLGKVQNLNEQFALSARVKHCLSARDEGLILFQVELPSNYWQTITRDVITELNLPKNTVGIAENRLAVPFQFSDAPHALFAGTSGSGKSEAVKSALVGLAQEYEPDGMAVIIIDPNMDYADEFMNLAHLAAPIATEASQINEALQWVNQELAYRKAENIRDGKPILVVIDEADSDVALQIPANLEIAKSIAKRGRKYNIHLLVATQKPNHKELPGILDNLLNRYIGLVSDAAVSYNLTGKGQLGAHLLTGQGDFLHVVGPNVNRFQVAMATTRDYNALPRAEIAMPKIEHGDIVIFTDSDEKQVGRPKNEIEPKTLAYYAHHGANKVSVRQAQADGISYAKHKMHVDFWQEFIRELKRLRGASI